MVVFYNFKYALDLDKCNNLCALIRICYLKWGKNIAIIITVV